MIFRKNQILNLFVFVCLSLNFFSLQATVFGKSYFNAPPPFRPASPELVSANRYSLEIDHAKRSQFSLMFFGSTTLGSNHFARYILPNCGQHTRKTLIAGEPGSAAANSVNNKLDLQAKYFNVLTAALPANGDLYDKADYQFQSELTFAPARQVFAINFDYRYHISNYLDRGWWVEVVAPLVFAQNDLNMQEEIIAAGGPNGNNPSVPEGYFGNMTDALKQNAWNFGKIDGKQSKAGFSDVQLRLGYTYATEQHYFLNGYFGMSIPFSGLPSNEFLFTPNISSNHIGLFTGYAAGIRVWAKCEKSIYWVMDTAGTFFFAKNQQRSLDLQGRPWSRYLPVFLSKSATQMNPGINSFTLPVQVTPDTVRDLNIAFVYKQNGLHVECGYHFYGRGAEKLQLLHNIDNNLVVGDNLAVASDLEVEPSCPDATLDFIYRAPASNGGVQYSKDAASIKTYLQVNNDQTNVGTVEGGVSVLPTNIYLPLTNDDLDLTSGAHPAMISNTLYGALGYHWQDLRYPVFAGFGAGYEIGSDDAALHQIVAWGRLDIAF